MIDHALAPLALAGLLAAAGTPPAFQDCSVCPRMVALPPGSFLMGSPPDDPERHKSERPQRAADVAAFAIGETEVTRGQFAAFVAETNRQIPSGCDTHGDGIDTTSDLDATASWREPRFEQTDEHPVVCLTWQDTVDYTGWLSKKTGQRYRLPSNAEWEYAARAGTTTLYFWGNDADLGCPFANGGDRALVRALPPFAAATQRDLEAGYKEARIVACDDGSGFTAAVRSYRPNAFGLYDVSGNVWEWVADCHEPAATSPPAVVASPCAARNVRGGSWDDWPIELRSADRHKSPAQTRRNDQGFRVVRDVAPAKRASVPPGSTR